MGEIKRKPMTLVLQDGTKYAGFSFGAESDAVGNIVLQNKMAVYQEALTDPWYRKQVLVLTHPIIGNYGVPADVEKDEYGLSKFFESGSIHVAALIIGQYCERYSHSSTMLSLSTWLKEQGIPGVMGIDTKRLSKHVQAHGTVLCKVLKEAEDSVEDERLPRFDYNEINLVAEVSLNTPMIYNPKGNVHVIAVDCGIKQSQIRYICDRGAKVTVVPWNFNFHQFEHDGLFLSNGPGNPETCVSTINQIKTSVQLVRPKPIFGIGLGHQLLALAINARITKTKYGNCGQSQLCKLARTNKCFIASPNNSFAVDTSTLPDDWSVLFTNVDDTANGGIVHNTMPFFSCEFYPENMAGDVDVLFDIFLERLTSHKEGKSDNKTMFESIQSAIVDDILLLDAEKVFSTSGRLDIEHKKFNYSGLQTIETLEEDKKENIQTTSINFDVATEQIAEIGIDYSISHSWIKLPNLIDVHVHVREPGQTHKEDFSTCTASALAGGITMILAMPNTSPAVTNVETIKLTKSCAEAGARCDYGIYMGASEMNDIDAANGSEFAIALKMYLNDTFTTLKMDNITFWIKHFEAWPKNLPICVHAERQTMAAVLWLVELYKRPVHFCHVARAEEIHMLRLAKERGLPITCEAAPHHLFLTADDLDTIGHGRGRVCPSLGTKGDRDALWENLAVIDCFATDHAPHAIYEKDREQPLPPPGFPGLETMVPLLLNAVNEGRLTMDDLILRLHTNPIKIFNLPQQPNTYVEVDMNEEWTIPTEMPFTKSKWTPFAGIKVRGAVKKVVLRGEVAYIDGQVLLPPGSGMDVKKATPIATSIPKTTDLNVSLPEIPITNLQNRPRPAVSDAEHGLPPKIYKGDM